MIVPIKQAQFKEGMTFAFPYSVLSIQEGVLGIWGDVCGEFIITDSNNVQHSITNLIFWDYGEIGNVPNEYLEFQIIEREEPEEEIPEEPPIDPPEEE